MRRAGAILAATLGALGALETLAGVSAASAAAGPATGNPLDPGGLRDAQISARTAADPGAVLGELGRNGAEWLFWSVPALDDARDFCCFGRSFRERRCSLADDEQGWGTTTDFRGHGPLELLLLIEVDHGTPRRLTVAGASCPIEGHGRRVTELDGVDPVKSLDLLERFARTSRGRGSDELGERALAALGYHAGDEAGRRLERMTTDRSLDLELRKNALFWAGQTRPELGVRLADRILAEDTSASGESRRAGEELREQALFVLSQSELPEATARLRRAAESDREPETRSKALFWLSQLDEPEAAAWIYSAATTEADREVREQAVFALSQIDGGVTYLVRLLRESRHSDVKQQALFWLGQSDDPRALDELERLLER